MNPVPKVVDFFKRPFLEQKAENIEQIQIRQLDTMAALLDELKRRCPLTREVVDSVAEYLGKLDPGREYSITDLHLPFCYEVGLPLERAEFTKVATFVPFMEGSKVKAWKNEAGHWRFKVKKPIVSQVKPTSKIEAAEFTLSQFRRNERFTAGQFAQAVTALFPEYGMKSYNVSAYLTQLKRKGLIKVVKTETNVYGKTKNTYSVV